jgi:ABC-type Fe3+-hydroxamate transport system substrate-binding protein
MSRTSWLGPVLDRPAEKIVSLVPSLTDAVFQVGAGSLLVARTKWCVRPEGPVESIETIGGTKDPDLERIEQLAPDVILANREENTKARILQLAERFPIWLTDPQSPEDVPSLWEELGRIAGAEKLGGRLARRVEQAIEEARIFKSGRSDPFLRFIYYVWKDPWMAAGHGTYISNLLEASGFRNGLGADRIRFPKLKDEELLSGQIDLHFFPDEPYRFDLPRDLAGLWTERASRSPHAWVLQGKSHAMAVDGELLSWYPSRTEEGLRCTCRLSELARLL